MENKIKACCNVTYEGTKQRMSVPMRDVFTYPSKYTRKECATGKTEADAKEKLDAVIKGYCDRTFIKCKSHKKTGKITLSEVKKESSWLNFFASFFAPDPRI